MAYTFGAATTDRVDLFSQQAPIIADGRVMLISCWVRPTTLTTGRKIWANGTLSFLEVGTVATTAQLRMNLDAVTTDGIWTSPSVLAVNTWTFVAVLINSNLAPASVRMWTGTDVTPPQEVTVSVGTAQSGTLVTGTSTLSIGNLSTGSLAFQGDIGGVFAIREAQDMIGGIGPTAISNDQAQRVQGTFIEPLWRGDMLHGSEGRAFYDQRLTAIQHGWQLHASLNDNPRFVNQAGPQVATVAGATVGARTPRPFENNMHNKMMVRRGRRYVRVT